MITRSKPSKTKSKPKPRAVRLISKAKGTSDLSHLYTYDILLYY